MNSVDVPSSDHLLVDSPCVRYTSSSIEAEYEYQTTDVKREKESGKIKVRGWGK